MNKKIVWISSILVVLLVLVLVKNRNSIKEDVVPVLQDLGSKLSITSTSTTPTPTIGDIKKTPTKNTSVKNNTSVVVNNSYPEIDFLDKRLPFTLSGYDNVDVTVDRVVFGRGDAVVSTGCTGVPNHNFSTYLYPGSGICISAKTVDGAPLGIVSVHALIENNGSYAFGGSSKIAVLHYLRATSQGKSAHRFADPISSLASYYINPYSSREVILSYLVPEDQLNFDLVFDYNGPIYPDISKSVYADSNGGVFIDFKNKDLTLITK